jgi:Flp pilus assembly CpaF family ATPase
VTINEAARLNGQRPTELSIDDRHIYVARVKAAVDRARADLAERTAEEAARRGDAPGAPDPIDDAIEAGDAAVIELRNITQHRLSQGLTPLAQTSEEAIKSEAINSSIGYGPLQLFHDNDDVEEICINAGGIGWVWWGGGPLAGTKTCVGQVLESDSDTIGLSERIIRDNGTGGQRLNAKTPFVRVGLPGGHRFVAVLGGEGRRGVSSGPLISLRRKRLSMPTLDSLVARKMLPQRLADQTEVAVRAGFGQLFAGPMASGKTTLKAAALNARDPMERTGTFERDVQELNLLDARLDMEDPLDVVEFFTRTGNTEDEGAIDLDDLIARNRQMRLDRVNLGEVVHGPDAWEMLSASTSASYRSLTTLHADDPTIVLDRLALYCSAHPTRPSEWQIALMIGQSVDLVWFIDLVPRDGRRERRVTSIREVGNKLPDGSVQSSEIWSYDYDADTLVQTEAYGPNLLNRIRSKGLSVEAFLRPGEAP